MNSIQKCNVKIYSLLPKGSNNNNVLEIIISLKYIAYTAASNAASSLSTSASANFCANG